jgi:hypothetical protein
VSYGYDTYNNRQDEWDTDWGSGSAGPNLRHTNTVYNTGATYLNANMVSLPAEVKVFDGAGTQDSDTKYGMMSRPYQRPIQRLPDTRHPRRRAGIELPFRRALQPSAPLRVPRCRAARGWRLPTYSIPLGMQRALRMRTSTPIIWITRTITLTISIATRTRTYIL